MMAREGQIIMSSVSKKLVSEDNKVMQEAKVKFLGKYPLQKNAHPEKLYELKGLQLLGRYFTGTALTKYGVKGTGWLSIFAHPLSSFPLVSPMARFVVM